MKKLNLLFLTVALFFGISTAYSQDRYEVLVDSYGEYNMSGKTYALIPSSDRIDSNDLEFKEFSTYIKKILAAAGAREAIVPSIADLSIIMHYEITDKSYVERVSVPIFGNTGVKSVETTTTTNGSTVKSTTNVTPTRGIVGYREVVRDVENFLRVINLYAYENKVTDKPVMLWKTCITSDGYKNNLRDVFPAMSYIALDRIAVSTKVDQWLKGSNTSFQLFTNLKINGDNVFTAPTIDFFNADEKLRIVAVERKPNETIVTFCKLRDLPSVSISSKMYLEFDNNKVYPVSAQNIKFDKVVKGDNTIHLFSIHYPAIPKNVTLINISEEADEKIKQVQKRKYWKGIHLVK